MIASFAKVSGPTTAQHSIVLSVKSHGSHGQSAQSSFVTGAGVKRCLTLASKRFFAFLTLTAGLVCNATSTSMQAAEINPDFLMRREPAEQVLPDIWVLSPELLPLWRRALTHPESEMQRQAAEAISRAHLLGHDGMQAAASDLRAIVVAPKSHPATRFAAARALIVLDQRSMAPALFEISQREGKDLHQLIEPALAKWNFEPIRDEWHHRIANATTPRRELILAINGVAEEHDVAATDDLLTLALPVERPSDVRLPAARAAGRIASSGLEKYADSLLKRQPCSVIDRLCAIGLVYRHTSEHAVQLLQKLGADAEPSVAAEALRSLFANDPKLVHPLTDVALRNADSNVRRVAIQSYVTVPTAERMKILAPLLDDPHPELRQFVRDSLNSLCENPELNEAIREASIAVLNAEGWRGQEQAALLLGTLDQESVAERLLNLSNSSRPEVIVATAWALKTISVPKTAASVLEITRRRTDEPNLALRHVDLQVAHLFELLGTLKYADAVPVMERYVPKLPMRYGETSRSAAIWALGLIFEGKKNDSLASRLMERVRDSGSMPMEYQEVRRSSALAVGRLQAASHVGGLKQVIGDQVDNERIDLAMRWAVLRLSGEALPLSPATTYERTGWFLEPVLPGN